MVTSSHCDPLTVDELEKMFRECSAMRGTRRKLLEAHFSMPEYTATTTQLAEAVGYSNFNAANLHYGLFAKSLVYEMNWQHRFMTDQGEPYPLWAFVDFHKEPNEMGKLT